MPTADRRQPPDYWPLFEAHHRVREPVYRSIIADVGLAPDALVLDAGCGDAFYSQLMVDVVGPDLAVVAVDHNPALLRRSTQLSPSIRRCQSDLERAGLRFGVFDAVWLCRAMHTAHDPLRRLSALASMLRSGGTLIVVENDLAHYPILSWSAEFERRMREALQQVLESRSTDGASIERYHAACHLPEWLEQIGLRNISMRTYAVEDIVPMARDTEAYWKQAMDFWGDLIRPFLSPEHLRAYRRAFDPESSDYLLRRPGFYCLELISVACGTAP